jgi:uncharacterized protein YfeS
VRERLCFDDPEEGPSRDTSHPEFVRVCDDELFYDCTDDFAPSGNDDGADALGALEDCANAASMSMLAALEKLERRALCDTRDRPSHALERLSCSGGAPWPMNASLSSSRTR